MSNFTCPTCGLTNIDCGKAGYKTTREIELEKKHL
nr:MAG TPA: Rad50 zinc hook motif [Caudoviricetes sp.]